VPENNDAAENEPPQELPQEVPPFINLQDDLKAYLEEGLG